MTCLDRNVSYRAPVGDGEKLCEPPGGLLTKTVADNRQARASHDVELHGRSLTELAESARAEALEEALAYTRSYGVEVPDCDVQGPLILSGHQPQWFHPGVWLKNFAAARIAQQCGGTAIHLIIDSDLCRSPTVRVPAGTVSSPRVEYIALDRISEEVPYEQRQIVDRQQWESFGERVGEAIGSVVPAPAVRQWWPLAIERSQQTASLGLALAQSRHLVELQWQSTSLELPQSRVCQLSAFRWFAVHLLDEMSSFHTVYNEALADYRRRHRIVNRAQPAADLGESDGWLETPFWIWSTDNPRRRALYVRRQGDELQLSDRDQWQQSLPISSGGSPERAVACLAEWEARGVKLRTRALMTTLFSRLLLADLFIHGIGGAKYDQVTEVLCEQFFGLTLPHSAVLSGTLRLPIEHATVEPDAQRKIAQRLRELTFHPEVHLEVPIDTALNLSDRQQIDSLLEQKSTWVNTVKTPENAAQRHAQIHSANQQLQPWLGERRKQLELQLAETGRQMQIAEIVESREYAAWLYPVEILRKFLLDFSPPMP